MTTPHGVAAIVAIAAMIAASGCEQRAAVVPLLTEPAGIEAGFRPDLSNVTVDDQRVAACVDDFKRTSGNRLKLRRAVGNEITNLLDF